MVLDFITMIISIIAVFTVLPDIPLLFIKQLLLRFQYPDTINLYYNFFLYASIGLILYIYSAISLSKIARKTNTPKSWLAWIPIANLYLMTKIAQVPLWGFLLLFLFFIPFAGYLVLTILPIWWWWKICKRLDRNSLLSLLILLAWPFIYKIYIDLSGTYTEIYGIIGLGIFYGIEKIGYFILIGILAWTNSKNKSLNNSKNTDTA